MWPSRMIVNGQTTTNKTQGNFVLKAKIEVKNTMMIAYILDLNLSAAVLICIHIIYMCIYICIYYIYFCVCRTKMTASIDSY